MRLMLGYGQRPSILVDAKDMSSDNMSEFDFWAVNGCWRGRFQNGFITVYGPPGGDFSSLDKTDILTTNQDRLRGDYETVFANFHNPNYVGPNPKAMTIPPEWDDDIPF